MWMRLSGRLALGVIVTLSLIMLSVGGSALAGPDSFETKLKASDPGEWDSFGCTVAYSGNVIVVGANNDTDNGVESGSAYVYTHSGNDWTETKLTASDGEAYDHFGESVEYADNTVFVGAIWDDDRGENSGAVYVYTRTRGDWTETKLTASDTNEQDQFGGSIACVGDTLFVGANSKEFNPEDPNGLGGAVYVFTRSGDTWIETDQLRASDVDEYSTFGDEVSTDGEILVVSASANDNLTGAVYVFARSGDTWSETEKLVASDAAPGDTFGQTTACSNGTIVVGSPEKDGLTGAAYVYTLSNGEWVETQLLVPDPTPGDGTGIGLACGEYTVLVGAPGKNGLRGEVYAYARSGDMWTLSSSFTASDVAPMSVFGLSIAYEGNTAVVGALADSEGVEFSGAVYVYRPVIRGR